MTSWQRLEQVIAWSGLSINAFAKKIRLKRSENLYQIKKGNFNISRSLAQVITTEYPTINFAWLLTGHGTMFTQLLIDYPGISCLPLFHSITTEFNSQTIPDENIFISNKYVFEAEMITVIRSNSLKPLFPSGALVLLKKASQIVYGNPYLIVGPDLSVFRIPRISSDDNTILLTSPNHEFDDLQIRKSTIINLYSIRGSLYGTNH